MGLKHLVRQLNIVPFRKLGVGVQSATAAAICKGDIEKKEGQRKEASRSSEVQAKSNKKKWCHIKGENKNIKVALKGKTKSKKFSTKILLFLDI